MTRAEFDRNDYLAWYIPRIHGPTPNAVDLSSSGVRSLAPEEIEIPAVDPWAAAGLVEAALASWLGIAPNEILFTPGATGGTAGEHQDRGTETFRGTFQVGVDGTVDVLGREPRPEPRLQQVFVHGALAPFQFFGQSLSRCWCGHVAP